MPLLQLVRLLDAIGGPAAGRGGLLDPVRPRLYLNPSPDPSPSPGPNPNPNPVAYSILCASMVKAPPLAVPELGSCGSLGRVLGSSRLL